MKEKPEIVWKADLQKNRRSGTIKTMKMQENIAKRIQGGCSYGTEIYSRCKRRTVSDPGC